jgi:hypothetical protein
VRTRATRGTISRSTLLLLECKITPGSHATRPFTIASSTPVMCAGVVLSELLGPGAAVVAAPSFVGKTFHTF